MSLSEDLGPRHLASRGGRQPKDVDTPRGGGLTPPSKKFNTLGAGGLTPLTVSAIL